MNRVIPGASWTRRLVETAIAVVVCGALVYALLSVVEESLAGSAPVVTVTEADNGKTVALKPGDILVIALESNPGTGYSWQVASVDASALVPTGQSTFHPGRDAMPGAPGRQTFQFTARESGTAAVKLIYVRPWEKNAPPGKTYRLNVAIR